jgi:chromosome segregation protein
MTKTISASLHLRGSKCRKRPEGNVSSAVFLKSLSLKGFKSFADPTVLQLEPGVTVVVGPNGSGKSNVVDAIAWVLGAQAPSSVRSQKMDDVIFAGTAKRPALGRAEVSLTIDNSAGLLDLEFSEVTVSRILFRSGDSEYAINGVPCRLLDVQELLSDAGVGRQQHVIVSQGQIDAVLNARPEERRAIIEEAAGVLKFRKRKERAERRLDSTEANLLRVQDLVREVRRQLKPLERQAEAARRHGELVAELTALQLYVAGREIAALRTRLGGLASSRVEHERTEREVKAELARLDAEVVALEAELTARGADDVGDRLMRVDQLRERARGLIAVIGERRRGIERDQGRLMDADLVATLEHDVARLHSELASVDEQVEGLAPELSCLEIDERSLRSERDAASGVFSTAATSAAASAAAEIRGELRSLRSACDRVERDHRNAVQRHQQIGQRRDQLTNELAVRRGRHDEASALQPELSATCDRAAAALAAAEAEAAESTRRRELTADEASRWAARAEALEQALDAAHARAAAKALEGVDGVLGTLLDLVEIDTGWEQAAEASIGEALQAVVVGDADAARRALGALRASDTHGAVLALGLASPRPSAPVTPAVGEAVRPHVRGRRPDVTALLDVLLERAVLVADDSVAVDVMLSDPQLIAVTAAGDRFASTGWRVGAGAGGGATAAALDEARARAEHASTALATANDAATSAREALAAAHQAARDASASADANDYLLAGEADVIERLALQLADVDAELEALDATIADHEALLARERDRISEFEAIMPGLEADEEAEAEAARARTERQVELDARAALLASRRRDLEVRTAGLVERRALLERRIGETEQRLAADTVARADATDRRLALEATLTALERLHSLVEAHRQAIDVEHAELVERRRRQSDEIRDLAARLEGTRRARTESEQRLEAGREHARRTEIDEAEARLRLENAIDMLRRDLDTEPEVAERAEQPELPDGVTAKARVRELERELRLLGPINPLALEEFNELQQRHEFLEEQLDDVRTTRRDLARVIKAVDVEIQTVFASAFADVSTNFTQLFETLFPGGSGKLVLTQPEDMLDTGIEVEAKPSGKNVKKLSLLSGGERSLTALAFLFAVFRSRPSPFYVMDEVEAALDDVNLHRFLGLLSEFRLEAQLLIVSHQKRTMEAGDCLLGVTMQPGGSSTVITERIA